MMWFHRAFWLGLVRGITELLPLSSRGHARLFQEILSEEAYRVSYLYGFTSLAVLLAGLIFFRKELKNLVVEIFKKKNYRIVLNALISGLPIAILTLLLNKNIAENDLLSSLWIVAAGFGVMGILLIMFNKLPQMKKLADYKEISVADAACVGLVDLFALVPGFSRFGLSLVGSKIIGLDTKNALKYSYLASIPSLVLITIFSFCNGNALSFMASDFWQNILALVATFAASMFVLAVCKKYFAMKSNMKGLAWYLIFAAIMILIFELLK